MKFSYDKLIIIGNCQSGKNLIKKILNLHYSKYVIYKDFSATNQYYSYLNFITTIVPIGKILFATSNGTNILTELNSDIYKTWKFIQIDRDVIGSVYSTILTNERKINPLGCARWVLYQERKQNLLFERIKNNAIRITFKDIFDNTIETMNRVFKFIELDSPKPSLIEYYKNESLMFRLLNETKCKIGNEAELLGSIGNELKDFMDYVIKEERQ